MDTDLGLLQRFVGALDVFGRDHWGQRSLLRASGTAFSDVLTLDEIERFLVSSARRPAFRLVQDGVTLPADRSVAPVRLGGKTLDDVADLGRIAAAVDGGATLVLQGLQRTWLPLAHLCRSLERATSHPVQANAYLTPAGSAGLGRHADEHDVLVLQVRGAKAWDVDDLGAVRTIEGDVLYIPAGVRHAASAQDGLSLHLTLGLLRVTHGQALRRALDGLPDADLRRPLPLGYARPEHADRLADDLALTLNAAADGIRALDPAAVAQVEQTRARTRRRPLPLGQLRSILALDQLDAASVVASRSDHVAALASPGAPDGRLVLELVDRRVLLPAVARPAMEQLLAGAPVRVGSLRCLDPESQLVLARRLVREGLLYVVDPSHCSRH